MGMWIAVVVVGVAGAAFVAFKRVISLRPFDAGRVSESWLREQRAEKQDRFPG